MKAKVLLCLFVCFIFSLSLYRSQNKYKHACTCLLCGFANICNKSEKLISLALLHFNFLDYFLKDTNIALKVLLKLPVAQGNWKTRWAKKSQNLFVPRSHKLCEAYVDYNQQCLHVQNTQTLVDKWTFNGLENIPMY